MVFPAFKNSYQSFLTPFFTFIFCMILSSVGAQSEGGDEKKDSTEKKGLPLKAERKIEIETNKGTWMSLDVSPDGKKIAFDLLGDIYEMPMSGGKATRITQGLSFDSHPKYCESCRRHSYNSLHHLDIHSK